MNSERWKTVQNLFHQVADQPRDEQFLSLQAACVEDSTLLADVIALLEADASSEPVVAGGFVYAVTQLFDDDLTPYLGKTFGPYLVLKSLGQGGMGKVFLAERQDYGGTVALKVLHGALSPDRRQRFAAEERMLAQLIHPSIARLYDAGNLPDGTPFFAMEYVDGVSFVEYCSQRRLSLNERAGLFRSVCKAVQFAHQHGIMHRDLKPSNIMVGLDGIVKLLDFGIAEPTEIKSVNTREWRPNFLTVAYAAPEQIRGELATVQADVYALGVILREVLAGETLDNDLDALCAKATHNETLLRYQSVDALIQDIDQYTSGGVLEARRPFGLGYLAGKFIRRNSRWMLAAASVTLLVVCLTAFYTVRLTKARDVAQGEAARALAVQRFIVKLFTAYDDESAPLTELKVAALVDRGEKELPSLNDHPVVQGELNHTLGTIEESLGRDDKAKALLTKALQQRIGTYGPSHSQVAETMIELGNVSRDQSRLEDAEAWLRKALGIYQRISPREDFQTAAVKSQLGRVLVKQGNYKAAVPLLESALQFQTVNKCSLASIGETTTDLAVAYFDQGEYSTSKRLNQRSLEIDRQLSGSDHPNVASDYITLAALDRSQGNYTEAEAYGRKALAIYQHWFGQNHSEVASAMTALAQNLTDDKQYSEADLLLKKALTIQGSLQSEPHYRVGLILIGLGNLETKQCEFNEAELHYSRALDIFHSVYKKKHSFIGIALSDMGVVHTAGGNFSKAEAEFQEALSIFKNTLSATSLDFFYVNLRLGTLMIAEGRFAEAEKWILDARAVLLKQHEPAKQALQETQTSLDDLSQQTHNPQKASLLPVKRLKRSCRQ